MYRVGIVGCGSIAWAHALGWSECPSTTLVGIADPVAAARDSLGDAFGVAADHRYPSWDALLDAEQLDIVSICTWAATHRDAVLAAAARRPKAILCEKPIAGCLGDAEAILQAAERARVRLAVSHQRRFYPGWAEARARIVEGAIGTPVQVATNAVGGLLNSATHTVDMIRYVLGDPDAAWVLGCAQRSTDGYERGERIEDSALGLFELTGGVRVFLECGLRAELPMVKASIEGTDGVVRILENRVTLLNARSGGWETVSSPSAEEETRAIADNPGFLAMTDLVGYMGSDESREFARTFVSQAYAMVDWIEGKTDSFPGEARNGYATLEIVLAILESTRLREVVPLPLKTRAYPLDLLVEDGTLPVTRPGRYDIRLLAPRGG